MIDEQIVPRMLYCHPCLVLSSSLVPYLTSYPPIFLPPFSYIISTSPAHPILLLDPTSFIKHCVIPFQHQKHISPFLSLNSPSSCVPAPLSSPPPFHTLFPIPPSSFVLFVHSVLLTQQPHPLPSLVQDIFRQQLPGLGAIIEK